jgi:hypothetical protein
MLIFDENSSKMSISGFRNRPSLDSIAAGVLAGDQTAVTHAFSWSFLAASRAHTRSRKASCAASGHPELRQLPAQDITGWASFMTSFHLFRPAEISNELSN